MGTDRELLEAAAKAAGIDWADGHESTGLRDQNGKVWNPLTDDGDALRLAVKLQLEPRFLDMDHPAGPPRVTFHNVPGLIVFVREDPYAATRRAIVRAAAEIGRNMP